MNKKNTDKLMKFFIVISAMLVFTGAFLIIRHYPYGNSLVIFGLIISLISCWIENYRLQKIIKEYEDKEFKADLDSKK
jgi:hypothetical protein